MLKKFWFHSQPKTTLFTKYIQSSADVNLAYMAKSSFHTLIVDLRQAEETLLAKCTPNCRNEIRKGARLGLTFQARQPTPGDGEYIDHFLTGKNLGSFNRDYLRDIRSTVCMVHLNGARLATHLYICPSEAGRVRLVYSAVAAPTDVITPSDTSVQRLIGIANRFLHFHSILHFKSQGLTVYDFGGIGLDESHNKIKGINDFKRSFGGTPRVEYNYTPIWISVIEKLRYHEGFRLPRRQKAN